MRPIWKAVTPAGSLGLVSLLSLGVTPVSAQTGDRDPRTARTNYSMANLPRPALPNTSIPTPTSPLARPAFPSTSASFPRPAARPYASPAPAAKPSRLKRFFSFLDRRGTADTGSRRIPIDASTARTDLPNARPWMNPTR